MWEWECPVGQWAPEGALSPEDCRCYPGGWCNCDGTAIVEGSFLQPAPSDLCAF